MLVQVFWETDLMLINRFRRWSCKGHTHWHRDVSAHFFFSSFRRQSIRKETKLYESIKVLKSHFVSDTREASAYLFISSWRQSLSCQYGRLMLKVAFQRTFITDTGKPLYIHSGLPGNRASAGDNTLWGYRVSSLTRGNICTFLGLLVDRAQVTTIDSEDGLEKGVHQWHRGSVCIACSFRSPRGQSICWDIELYESGELYPRNSLEWLQFSVITLCKYNYIILK